MSWGDEDERGGRQSYLERLGGEPCKAVRSFRVSSRSLLYNSERASERNSVDTRVGGQQASELEQLFLLPQPSPRSPITMEVDSAIEPRPEAARPAPRITLPEDSPYDLEQVAANYEGERAALALGSSERYSAGLGVLCD